ncbi:MAG: FAD-binding protein, partial [Adlercreutzia equolifaciens]
YTREDLANDNLALQCLPGKGNKGNYVVFDQAIFDRFFGKNDDAKKAFYDAIKANGGGSIYQSDSLADLAGRFNLDADALKAAVDRYNELCGEGADSDFGKAAGLMAPIETPPFYLAKLSYNYFFSVGGITTDGRHRVLDGRRSPIEVSMPSATTATAAATCTPSTCRRVRPSSEQRPRGGNAVLEYLDR